MAFYGDNKNDLLMEIIMNKLSSTHSFPQVIKTFENIILKSPQSQHLINLSNHFKNLSKITNTHEEFYHLDLLEYTKQLLKNLITY